MNMSNYNRYKVSAQSKQREEKVNKHINFVVIAYIIILFYLLFIIYISFTKETIHYVYAEPGEIFNEGTFQGVLIKNESVVYSNEAGPVKYYVPEGAKVRQNSYVCSVNQDAETDKLIDEQINKHLSQLNNAVSMTVDDYSLLQNKIREYVLDKPSKNVDYVYTAKDMISGTLLDISKTIYIKDEALFKKVQEEIAINEEQRLNNGTYYHMEKSGVIGYTFDGFEDFTLEDLDYSVLSKTISVTDATDDLHVKVGDPLYKIIENHIFYVVSEIDASCMKYLEDKTTKSKYTTLYFPRKNIEIVVKIQNLITKDDKYYVTYELDRFFDEFFNDRFVDYRIIYDDYAGLKIPNEAVEEKGLYQVPKSAVFSEKGSYKIQKKVYSEKDTTHEEIVSVVVKVYYEDNEFAYIDVMDNDVTINNGDIVLYTLDESSRVSDIGEFTLQGKTDIEGVYVINKGYTDFRRIKTVYQDESFRIIDSTLGYSVGLFDKVASDASEISEFTTIN